MQTTRLLPEDLAKIKQQVADRQRTYRNRIMLCGGTGCRASGSLEVKAALTEALKAHDLGEQVHLVETGCNGFCAKGPVMTVLPDDTFYQCVSPADCQELVERHLLSGQAVERLMYVPPGRAQPIPRLADIPFFARQHPWALRNKGLIDPERIEDSIWRDGYQALAMALLELEPREIIDRVKSSGLRGRGGGGFPTGLKWEFCAAARGDEPYVMCNADEGDPGAFMDRSIMEADPHAVIEGMAIAGRAIGASQGVIYCRAEYPLAVDRLEKAIQQAREFNLLGRGILGTDFAFDVRIARGAGAFVCGEETALMASVEGRRGTPRPRPPFPAVSGLWAKPTVLNNVETYANVPAIIRGGAEAFASLGTESSKGTKVFALTGKLENIGLVEVPMGTPLGDIIFDIGGGIPDGKKFKAAQLGGPSGGCLPVEHLNTPTEYEAITRAGAIMGSGGLIVMDEDTCMVDMARFFMEFCQEESCGKCSPCRVGTRRMLQILERICQGHGREGDVELLVDLAQSIKDAALCGLGQTAPNPVLSTIRYFRAEYDAHIRNKHCPAAACSALFASPCQHTCPVGMDIPGYVALVRASRFDDAWRLLKQTNPFPSVCGRVCSHPCQTKCRRGQLDEPVAIRNLKRFITDNARHARATLLPTTRSQRVAIVGAGPAGLTAALELRRRGYAVNVFEELPEAGGMLRYGIPEYRLPRDVLAAEIQDILDTGVELRTGVRVGRDLTLEEMERDHQVIFLAVGAHRSLPLGIQGEDAEGVVGATEWLRQHNLGQRPGVGKRVAVIGGGNAAVDAARTALRLGAEQVSILYRRERKDMPAWQEEVDAAAAEGVSIYELVAPVRIEASDGHVTGILMTHCRLDRFDRSGRRSPVPMPDGEHLFEADMVMAAISQAPELDFLGESDGVRSSNQGIETDPAYRTSNPRIWAAGDAVTGPAMVIDAIQAGRDVADEIDRAFRLEAGEPDWSPPPEDAIEIPFVVDEDVQEAPQARMPEAKAQLRRRDFREVELGFTAEMAMAEACRCLRCDGRGA